MSSQLRRDGFSNSIHNSVFEYANGVQTCVLVRRASTLSNAVSSLASTGMSFTKVDEREKQAALEEEQARLKALKVRPGFKGLRTVLLASVQMLKVVSAIFFLAKHK